MGPAEEIRDQGGIWAEEQAEEEQAEEEQAEEEQAEEEQAEEEQAEEEQAEVQLAVFQVEEGEESLGADDYSPSKTKDGNRTSDSAYYYRVIGCYRNWVRFLYGCRGSFGA
jgi:hypothetical protein